MNQKQKSLLILKALVIETKKSGSSNLRLKGFSENSKGTGAAIKIETEDDNQVSVSYLVEKIDACLDLANPDVLLSLEARKIYNKIVEDIRKQGKII